MVVETLLVGVVAHVGVRASPVGRACVAVW